MLENTNKAIAINSAVLYIRMAVTTLCSLLTTRFALQALGVVDYGLYSVLGGIIGIISIFNTIMLSTSNRFIAVAIGKGDIKEVNKQFNVNLSIHAVIAAFALLVAIPLGLWYIPRYINYDGPLSNAIIVYIISVLGSIVSFIGVPYNGLLMAKEKFILFSIVDLIIHVVKLLVAWILVYYIIHKLFVYTITMSLLTAASTMVYILYCYKHYHDLVRICIVRERNIYKQVFSFSAWVAFGSLAHVGKNQGAALIINAFFNTVMNTAMGIASSVNNYVSMFAQNLVQPMQPQIVKSYASGNIKRTDELLIMSTKYSFLLVLLISSVFLIEPEWILQLWLGEAPPYASVFLVLFVVDSIIQSVNAGVSNIIWASGKISLYQVITSSLNVLSVLVAFFVLKGGAAAYYLSVVYIIFSIIRFFAIQWALHYTLNYDNRILWKHSYIPSLIVAFLFAPIFFLPHSLYPIIRIIVALFYLLVLEWFLGLTHEERMRLKSFVIRNNK